MTWQHRKPGGYHATDYAEEKMSEGKPPQEFDPLFRDWVRVDGKDWHFVEALHRPWTIGERSVKNKTRTIRCRDCVGSEKSSDSTLNCIDAYSKEKFIFNPGAKSGEENVCHAYHRKWWKFWRRR